MRTIKKTVCFVLIAFIGLANAIAAELQLPHVTVYGTATTEVVPDQLHWAIRVKIQGPELEDVAKQHAKAVESVLVLLQSLKIDKSAIQTSQMEFGENWEYRSSSRVRAGYISSTAISFKILDLDLYTKIWLALAKMSSVSVENVTYDHSKRIQYQNQTREKAVVAAQEKAGAMAKALGASIGEPLFVEEDLVTEMPWSGNAVNNLRAVAGEGQQDQAESLSPGTIPVKVRVRASFRLVSNQK